MHWLNFLGDFPALLVISIAVLASLLAEIRLGAIVVPVVEWEMAFGMIVGPHGLKIAQGGELLEWFGHQAGLAGLFFMAGMQLDLNKVKERSTPPPLPINPQLLCARFLET
jgi:Kef-type K+ transport system membrane component KefB